MAEHKKHRKRKPRTIVTHRHDNGTYSHEHHYDDGGKPAMYAGTSAHLDDVKQHMEDNFGGPDEPESEQEAAAEAVAGGPGEE